MKVTTKRFLHQGDEDIRFDYIVNVTKTGMFYTNLPADAVLKIEAYGLTMPVSNRGNRGYFEAPTLDQLETKIRDFVSEAVSRELVDTYDVIEYQISIGAMYCKNFIDPDDNQLYPNGSFLKNSSTWVPGLTSTQDTSFSVYARPRTLKKFRYSSGKETTESYPIDESNYPADSAVRFLDGVLAKPNRGIEIKTLRCTESNAGFFKSAILSIWTINEELGQLLKDDTLETVLDDTTLTLRTFLLYGNN